ncbi:MAG: isoamylase early set domain-containing protein [Opitutaceae bacterium]|nr:isoamylase early set domain-containing protein [Opitutaceae bacterium]
MPDAESVNLAGSFNDWDPASLPMKRMADGRWGRDLDLPVGRYEFRLVIDGVWADVPGATDTVENSFGSRNAVLMVAQSS